MKSIIALFLCILISATSNAQESFVTRKTINGKAKEAFDDARKAYGTGDVKAAMKAIEKAIEKEPTFIDAYFQKAVMLSNAAKLNEAELTFEKALSISSTYEPDAIYSVAELERKQNKESEAIEHYKQFLASKSANKQAKDFAQTYIQNTQFLAEAKKNPVSYQPVRLDSAINTSLPEYFPCLTADGETMIFTRRERQNEDFFISKKQNGKWQKAIPIDAINTPENEGAETIAADGKTIVFTGCNRPYGLGSCDLYISEFVDGKWTNSKNMGPNVNSKAWDSQPSLSADGHTIYFSSSREGGLGKEDIWMSEKQADGTWSIAKNVGTPINTAKSDIFPFLHQDNETFYYITDGYPGVGGMDIFYTRLENGKWQTPTNIGYPINTVGDEAAFIVSVDGKTAYIASENNSREEKVRMAFDLANIDIYSLELYEKARPKPVTYLKGNIFDAKTLQKLRAKAEIIELESNKIFATAISDANGAFLICLPSGKNYALNVNRKNYAFYSDNFALEEKNLVNTPFILDIPLQAIETAKSNTTTSTIVELKPIILKNIFFETGSAKLKPTSFSELNRLKILLDENPVLKIQINGHTDNIGNDADNMSLSLNRAKAVYDYLVEQKIDSNRLKYKGFGENIPIQTNDTTEGRQTNRRTEFQVLSN